jgi:hypothetical protein
MADLTVERKLVKSAPELWSELSEVESLARHLGELGEIRITKVEPETTVAWEGEQVSGTVEIEQSGWGTKVTFRATVPEPDPPRDAAPPAEPEPEPEPVPEPVAVQPEPEPEPEPAAATEREPERIGFWARVFRKRRGADVPPPPESQPIPEPELEPEPVAAEPEPKPEPASAVARVQEILDGTLDALGQAHHRPFSRG